MNINKEKSKEDWIESIELFVNNLKEKKEEYRQDVDLKLAAIQVIEEQLTELETILYKKGIIK